jgi:methylmalonyl-CoA/ethylmalonyl-CoA epimerase
MRRATHEGVKISHVGLAVRSIAEALPFYRDILGLEEESLAETDGARIAGVDAGGTVVEFLEAEREDSPIAKFIAKRGPGIHHICFAVDDLDATLKRCKEKGVRLIDEAPRVGAEGKRIAFLHPASTAGILIELTES